MSPTELLTHAIRLIVEEQLDQALKARGLAMNIHPNDRSDVAKATRSHALYKAAKASQAAEVTQMVADAYNMKPHDIITKSRTAPGPEARQVVITLLKEMLLFSNQEAAAAVRLTNPTSTRHARKRVAARQSSDPVFAERLQRLRTQIAANLKTA